VVLWRKQKYQRLGVAAVSLASLVVQGGCKIIDNSETIFDPAALNGVPSVSLGPFLGGPTGGYGDAKVGISEASLTSASIPTGGTPSPTFGAKPWTQDMLLFEEFGTEPLVAGTGTVPPISTSNDPANLELSSTIPRSAPTGAATEVFLAAAGLNPFPTRVANTTLKNPWWNDVCSYIKTVDCAAKPGPAEGRPGGEGWAHQRWDEFPPQRSFKTAQMGARENLGFRDSRQMHKYAVGEFGPGGLYHRNGTSRGIKVQFHPSMPVQQHHVVWTFDGTMPPKLLQARYGEPLIMRHYNFLPIDVSANAGFGLHTLSTHEHNGHNPAESDGYANAFFFPGQYYDYRWPLTLAGYDTVNKTATDAKTGTPCVAGESMRVARATGTNLVTCDVSKDPAKKSGIIKLRGDWHETMSTHWFHDHMIDFTSKNVYKGNAAMMNYYSAIDRGNETLNDGVNLRLPSGSALSWGNRDYDINLSIGDKAWDAQGQLFFNPFDTDGFLGDNVLVNWSWRARLPVRARRYRFRILNAAVARYFKIALVREIPGTTGTLKGPAGSGLSYEAVPFHMIANDGNLMQHSVAIDGTLGTTRGIVPTQSIAERYDIIVDFAKNGIKPGDKLYFVNVLEHDNGRLPKRAIPLAEVLNETYKPVVSAGQWKNGDPAVGKFLRFDVTSCVTAAGRAIACTDPSLDPALYVEGNRSGPRGAALTLIVRPTITQADLKTAINRKFEFVRGGGGATDALPWAIKTDNGPARTADMQRVSAAPNLGALTAAGLGRPEVWTIVNTSGGWSHPVHVHFEEGQILSRGGNPPPIWEKWARKDMYRVGPEPGSESPIVMAARFREFAGTFMEHCHNTTHEDHAMLLRWDIERPGQLAVMPTPVPTWFGVDFIDSVTEPTFRSGLTK